MLDIRFIRENRAAIELGAKHKNIRLDLEKLLSLDQDLRTKQTELEKFQADRNRISKEIASADPASRERLKAEVSAIKAKMEQLEPSVTAMKDALRQEMLLVPNPARADVPIGKDDSENVEVKKWGTPRSFSFKPLDHAELGKIQGILDTERGVKIAGSRSYILKGDLALLEHAVLRFTVDKLASKGYTPMSIPVLVKEDCMTGTGYFPTGREQAFYIEKDELALVGTAEVSLTSYYWKEILKESDLPFRSFAQSGCFRREAGTYGKDTSGLYRVHQFQKVEQVIIAPADPTLSEQLHAELVRNAEEILEAFELPYRVVYVCTGDLGQGQIRKHDIETWMPSRNNYAETHSCSTFHDFQARRLEIRYKNKNGEMQTCYTLNNTAIASPRILIPLLENHQNEDGTINVPKALQPCIGGRSVLGTPVRNKG
jgi:seryl-tRNA synthetase